MMKELVLIRHAKSSWDDLRVSDHDRPLNVRGERDAPFMATWLSSRIAVPDMVIVSTAVRARETADKFIKAMGISEDHVVRTRDVYEASVDSLLDTIAWVPPQEAERVMVVGHNPTMTMMLDRLTTERVDNMPTCSIAVIRFPEATSWKDLPNGELSLFATPKGVRGDT